MYVGDDVCDEDENADEERAKRARMCDDLTSLSSRVGAMIPILQSFYATAAKDEEAYAPETFKQPLDSLREHSLPLSWVYVEKYAQRCANEALNAGIQSVSAAWTACLADPANADWTPPDGCFDDWVTCVSWKDGATPYDIGIAFVASCVSPTITKDSVDKLMRTLVVDGMQRSCQQDFHVDFSVSEEAGSSDEEAQERLKCEQDAQMQIVAEKTRRVLRLSMRSNAYQHGLVYHSWRQMIDMAPPQGRFIFGLVSAAGGEDDSGLV